MNGTATRVPVCTSCGVVAPIERARCEHCEAPLGEVPRRTFTPPLGDVYFAAIRASFTCRSCGFASPFDGVTVEDGAPCVQCGSYQRIDDDAWPDALAFAHGVADLAGPGPEGRFADPEIWIGEDHPHRAIGRSKTFATRTKSRFRIDATAGFPVCTSCKALLHVHADRNVLTTTCHGCRATGRFETPPALATTIDGLAGLCGEAHRLDLQEVRISETAEGLQILRCPTCGANLPPVNQRTVECNYCHTTALVPPRGRVRGKEHLVRPIVFWVAFRGPSEARRTLTRPGGAPTKKNGGASGPSPKQLAKIGEKMGLALEGIETLPQKRGVDVVQLIFSIAATGAAIGIGYLVALAFWL